MTGSTTNATCELCGSTFHCGVESFPGAPCWCTAVTIGPSALTDLAGRSSSCVCPTCLAAAAQRPPTPGP